jgi:hypothetical protein
MRCSIRRSSQIALLTAALSVASGCYSYRVVPVNEVTPGQDVRIRISAAEAVRLGELIERGDRSLDGRLLENTDGEVVLGVSSVSQTTALTAMQDPSGHFFQRIAVPREGLLELEVRTLNRTHTAIVVGLLAAVSATVAYTQFTHQSAVNEKGKGGSQALRIPIALPLLGR